MPVTAAVLAGGHSDRMGVDKLRLPVAGQPLLERVADVAAEVCDEVLVVGGDKVEVTGVRLPEGARVLADEVPGQGPLGGLATALGAASNHWVLAVAGDLPWLSADVIRALWDARDDARVVVPVTDSGPEPLLALYHKDCLGPAKEALGEGKRRLVAIFPSVDVAEVPAAVLQAVDPGLASLVNVNTPEDLVAARDSVPREPRRVRTAYFADGDEQMRLPDERPVTVYLNLVEIATMQATPADLEDLAVGFLWSEGLLKDRAALREITADPAKGLVWVKSAEEAPKDLSDRKRFITAGCGKGVSFASVAHMERIKRLPDGPRFVDQEVYALFRDLAAKSVRYRDTGGVHSVGLAKGGSLVALREDVGRHNAVDKVLGHAWLEGMDLSDAVLVSSGRISYEMAVKAASAGVPVVVSRTAVTGLARDVAERANLTLIGYARGGRMVVYSGAQRINREGDAG